MIIRGIGSFLPENIVTNEQIEKTIETSSTWIEQKLGIKERRVAGSGTSSSDLGAKASIRAIQDAGLTVSDIDLILCVTSTPDRLSPSTACLIQEKIGAFNSAAFDLNAVCSGFIYGLEVSNSLLKTKKYSNILLVACETYSKITDWSARNCVFFGDGAGAVILQDAESIFDCIIRADGRGKENFTVRGGGSFLPASHQTVDDKEHFFKMNGREVYKTGIKVLPESILELLSRNCIDISEINHLVPHQPSINILKETARIINFNFEKVAKTMHIYANTAGASIPVTLDHLNKNGKLNFDDMLLFAAVGSGWTWGSAIIQWKK